MLLYRDYLFDLLGGAGAASRADAASRGGSSPAPAPAPSPPENDNPDFPNSFDSITYEIDSAIGSNGLDVQNDSEVHDLAEVVGQVLDMDTGDSLELINALIETGNFTQGMTGEDMYYVLNGPRYGLLGHNAKYDDFISQWKPHDSQQSQIDELNQRIETWDGHSIAGPTNQGEPHVWHKGLALAQSLSLMMAADPFEVRSMILDLHTSGHITEDATGEDIFVLFDFNHDSIIDSSDLEHYEAHNGDVDSFHRVLMASDEDITTEEIESIINDPVLRSNPHIVQNLVDNDSVSDDYIVELLLPHDSLNESGTGFVTTPQTEEIILVVADSDRFENPDIAGAIYNSENTPLDVRREAADILGIPPLPDPPPIGYPEEVRQGGLWHRAKEWFHHVEDAVKDDITALSGLEDDFFNQFGTAGEIAGFLQGIGVEAVEFIVMTEVIAAAAGVIASAGFTVVAAGTAVLATEIGIEELIAHIKDPDAGHLTGPVGSAIKSVVTSVAQSAKELITDLPSNISTLLESGYVLVVPDDRGERARFVNPNTEAGQTQLQRDDVKLYANQHTQDSLSDQYEFEGTTQQFKHERPFEHGDALGHFVGEAIQEVLILKDVAKLALNAGKTGVEAIVNLFKDSAAEDLGLATEITTSTGESYSPREYANLLKDHSNPSEAFNDFLKLSKDERISVLHEGYTPEVPLELQSYNFYELNQFLQNNDITARITFNSEGELEIYLKDSAGLNVPEDKRLAIQGKIEEHLSKQLDAGSVKEGSFHWLGPNDSVPSENYKAATVGKGGNLEGLPGGAPAAVPYDETFQLEPGTVGRQQYYNPDSPWGNSEFITPLEDQRVTWDGVEIPDEYKVDTRAFRSDHRLLIDPSNPTSKPPYNPTGETWEARNPYLKNNLREVFNNGVTADRYKGTFFNTEANNADVFDHTDTNGASATSNFLSGTTDIELARSWGDGNKTAVILDADVTGVDVEGAAEWAQENGLRTSQQQHNQSEISIWNGTQPEKIRGVYLIEALDNKNIADSDNIKITYIRNPYYGK
ncbi:MAG: hypothetical protein O2827_04385 [Verrucomicrobia bacterium]|nr:hypothetical protein [Verrucomicrobiota bacterium]